MISVPQSTAYTHVFKAYLSSDHVTEATGKTIAITISKNAGAFGNPSGGATNATEISNGWYSVALSTTDMGTLGWVAIRGTAATIDDEGDRVFVVKATTGGWTALPDTAVTTNASLLTSGTGTAQLSVASGQVTVATNGDKTGYSLSVTPPTAAAVATAVWTDTTTGDFTTSLSVGKSLMNGVSLGTGLTIVSVSGSVGSVTGAVGSVTGAVGSVTGAVGSVTGAVGSVTAGVTVTTNNDKTGYSLTQTFPTNFSALGISAGGHVSNVDTLTTYTGNTVQTGDAYARLGAPAGASSAADIAAINAKTTNLPASPSAVGSAMTLTSGERNSVADALLDRDMSTGADSGSTTVRTVRQALRFLRNKWAVVAGVVTVYKEDDSTASWTAALSTDAAAVPVIGSDPAGP